MKKIARREKEPLYALTPGDKSIFDAAKAQKDPNIFLNYYLKSETSGSYWLPGAKTKKWRVGYERLRDHWNAIGKPDKFTFENNVYHVQFDHEKILKYPTEPAFFHNHGLMMYPFAKELYLDRTAVRTVVGGFGVGKTLNVILGELVDLATVPGYVSFGLAANTDQVKEIFDLILQAIEGTEYEKRFFIKAVTKPRYVIYIGNDQVGVNRITCMPIPDNPKKIRSLTGDCAFVDQAEEVESMSELLRSVGTRFRGRHPKYGRPRKATLTLIANSEDNDQLWEVFDRAETEPEQYKSMMLSTYDNPYLTDDDIVRFEAMVGDSKEDRDRYLLGHRPLGNGEHFSKATLDMMRDTNLDRVMDEGKQNEIPGYAYLEAGGGVGCYEWLLPPVKDRTYLVISDPGTKNPPHRDSPPILIWDITDFPGTREEPMPAKLVGFVWVFGNKSIDNWASRYAEIVRRYNAQLSNGFDATGFQSGYDQWLSILKDIFPEKINLSGNNKYLCLNAAKIMTTSGMVKVPAAIRAVFDQLSRYKYPEPEGMRQDVTMAFIMSCWWLQRLYFYDNTEYEGDYQYDRTDRHARPPTSRHRGHAR
jgi:hypothetical protein